MSGGLGYEAARDFSQRNALAVNLIEQYGGIDGGRHKQWVLDQVLRALLGPDGYEAWRRLYEDDDEYEWDEGIAP